MLKNYFKIAIAVLKRRKFFTFISLFGISFTLTILIVLTAFVDHLFSPSYPDPNRDRELFVNRIRLEASKKNGMSMSPLSFYFFDHYVAALKTPSKIAVYTNGEMSNGYKDNRKIVVELKYTNQVFWDVYQFQFLEGKPFTGGQLENRDKVVVISAATRAKYFGEEAQALGKYIEANNTQYRVVGVVKPVPFLNNFCYADLYLPYTLVQDNLKDQSLQGRFCATIQVSSSRDLPALKKEFAGMISKLPRSDESYDLIYCYPDEYLEVLTRGLLGQGKDKSTGKAFLIFGSFLLLFMLLPTINLVNINLSRIMERSSEIGVRKAFGASARTLTYQFIVENLILTLFGGLLGLIFSLVVLHVLNASDLSPNMELKINPVVLFYSLLACLVFGLLSGVYPAWRMSKINVVTALKANN
ncbi:putative ABC transport system permease protein [Pedobacter westerhofensis]|uniref:Putative ABC transport system permease protein n=1 Tax=Pedobacter westerhofensis TaxID=425512 RepID=A0A521CMZ9_9SPHI|nr:FtsX-like permease family protein [Pedobacter westerhofensis]SMO60131.1 putative ABC transport system permease protein [Pedobacter westerhofensis]